MYSNIARGGEGIGLPGLDNVYTFKFTTLKIVLNMNRELNTFTLTSSQTCLIP